MTTFIADELAIEGVYSRMHRLPLQGQKSVLTAHSGPDGAKILKLELPMLTAEDHVKLARDHLMRSLQCRREYVVAIDDAAMSLWGRPWRITDYRVSGVGRDEFSTEQKNRLRTLLEKRRHHEDIGRAHAHASGLRAPGVAKLLLQCEIEDAAIVAEAVSQCTHPRLRG